MDPARSDRGATAGVIAPPPLLALAALALGFGADWAAPLGLLRQAPSELRYALGAVLVALALTIFALALRAFSRAGTPVQTRRSTTSLVTTGIYAHVRNPIYVAATLTLTGVALAAAADWLVVATMLYVVVIHFGVVRREEAYLEARFGGDYRAYKARVPRYGWRS